MGPAPREVGYPHEAVLITGSSYEHNFLVTCLACVLTCSGMLGWLSTGVVDRGRGRAGAGQAALAVVGGLFLGFLMAG